MFKILCIVQAPVPSTEISIIRPFSYLERERGITWKLEREALFRPKLLEDTDIVVFHRNCHPKSLTVLDTVKASRLPIIYELDDNFFEMPEELPIGRYFRIPIVVQTLENYLRTANIIKIGSPELIPLVSKYNRNIVYQPYAVDLSLLDEMTPNPDTDFTIGYAGTIYHRHDLKFIIESILRISREFPQIHWDFIGCLPEGVESLSNYSFTPFIYNYSDFLQDLYRKNWQIGLCPILDLPHNRCKTDNKLREYGACRIAGIYSNLPPYSANVQHGVTGLLVQNTEQSWYEAIKTLIVDQELRRKIAEQVREWVETQRAIPVIAGLWVDLFQKVLGENRSNSENTDQSDKMSDLG